jgi:hypothetical protein
MGVCCTTSPFTAALITAVGVLAACSNVHAPVAAPPSLPVPPPAVSAIDHTVTVTWQLADSFDILPTGQCAGRGDNRGMKPGARIQLHGNSTGLYDETTATASFQRRALSAKTALIDDGLYCVLRAVFAPSLPDPDGYSIKFPGTPVSWEHLGRPGGTPFGRPDNPPGYGGYNLGSQTCPSLLDPPEKDCPEWAD